jgi:hypothetical protein
MHGMIAYPFYIARYSENRHKFPQIARHRLLGGDNNSGIIFNLSLQRVNFRVIVAHFFCKFRIACPQSGKGLTQIFFHLG